MESFAKPFLFAVRGGGIFSLSRGVFYAIRSPNIEENLNFDL